LQKTSQQSDLKKFQEPTSGLPDFLVRIFRSQAASEGLTESEADSFLKLLDSSRAKMPKINPNGLSLKMLKICYPLIEDGTLQPFSIRWPHSAMIVSTDFLIHAITESHKIENASNSGNKSPGKIFPLTGSDGKTLIQLIGGMQGQRVYSPEGTSVTLSAQSGGWGGKTGLYFVDLNKNSKITDTARCIKARYNAGITNRGADNSGVYYACARAVLTPNRIEKRQNGPRFKPCGEPSFTLTAQDRHGVMLCDCENCQKRIRIKEATKLGYAEAGCGDSINFAFPNSKTRRGRIGKGVAQTLETGCNQGTAFIGCGRIRRLTPRECWRLQGFSDEMFDKARTINSDNQLYKQAGNSVTVTVVFALGMKILEVKREMEGDDCGR